jgi:thymidylate kinase
VPAVAPHIASDQAALATAVAFFDALNGDGLRYCHWKSNLRLSWGLCGRTDLDLLVDPTHAARFHAIRRAFPIMAVEAPAGKRYPSIEDYVGFDAATGRLFHLHVHYRLILGEQFVKNYHIPLEGALLDSAVPCLGVKVPEPELELLILSLRALLKYRDRDALKDTLAIRSPGLPAHITEEVSWLASRTSVERVRAAAERHLPEVAPIVEPFLAAVGAQRDGRRMLSLRRQTRRALRGYQRDHRAAAILQYARESLRRRKRLRFGQPPRRMSPGDGAMIAFVGADGAGKTTLTHELKGWLCGLLEARRYYQGSKEPSLLTRWLYVAFRGSRRLHRAVNDRWGQDHPASLALAAGRDAWLHTHYLSTALDRYRRHRAGRREASRGTIVIFDRYPLNATLDGPQIRAISGRAGLLARWEEAIYRRFSPPDLLVILLVAPEVALSRKPDHSREAVEAKSAYLNALSDEPARAPAAATIAVNANRPYADVLVESRQAIWNTLTS